MLRLLRPLTTLLGLVLLTANAASALALASAENRASGSAAVAEHLVGQNTRLSEEATRENLTLRYDLASDSPVAAEGAAAIETPYALEVQSASAEAQAALSQAQNGATLYRTGTLGSNMAGESQYWSLQNPLTNPGYASQMGVPGGTPNFLLQGTLSPGASVITNEAAALGSNVGGGIQIVTSPGGVANLIFTMPY
jgi:hypothetical protein